ncbi:chromatin associated protein KTI12 [Exidia glandulosa HHB12029]|uniref:Chromatin associated protein KTI12 n=1 Tax=Exidia glandulosa HHB12029 TaxID=1314781 RepID=A0A165N5F7_EXIGL|nr:chromatin associated protein KTI12 [Exidia glandulosa HHB12029]
MALVTVTGFPSSGKTRRVAQLIAHLDAALSHPDYDGPKYKVEVISDQSLNIARAVYNDSRSEKPARAALFTAVQRQLGKNTILIVDAMNYIKGFRYQMFCAAKEAGVRVCTVFAAAPPDKCKEWHAARDETDKYDDATFDNLLMRYEEPSSMVRWDSPLFIVACDDQSPPLDDIWKAVTAGNVQVANAGTAVAPRAPVDALQVLEGTTTSLVSMIMTEQTSTSGLGGNISLSLPSSSRLSLVLPPRNVTLSELQRNKRQFVTAHRKAITQGAMEKGAVDWTEESIARKFLAHLQETLQ